LWPAGARHPSPPRATTPAVRKPAGPACRNFACDGGTMRRRVLGNRRAGADRVGRFLLFAQPSRIASAAMLTRFYFHLVKGENRIVDRVGTELCREIAMSLAIVESVR